LDEQREYPIVCRHSTVSPCFKMGTKDKGRNSHEPAISTIRKSTVDAWFVKDTGNTRKRRYPSSTSTKTKIHQIVARTLYQADRVPQGQMVRHLCGCSECCNREHLKLGTAGENYEDQHYHHVFNKLHDAGREDMIEDLVTTLDLEVI